jgi:ABC-type uncharacterized transport system substrate-binding protein
VIIGNRQQAVGNSKKLKHVPYVLCALLFALCGSTEAQQAGKIFRVGFLDSSNAAGMAGLLDVFRQELSKLGWIEGKNIAFEYRFAEQKNGRLPELAADLVRLKVDVIVVTGGGVPLAAKKATSTIPIVMASGSDPVASGLVASLARAGRQSHWSHELKSGTDYQTPRGAQGRGI